jgi:hypothetical protein
MARQGQGAQQLVVASILTAAGSGAVATNFVNGPLLSDVVDDDGTVFDDFGQASLRLVAKNPTGPAPTALNDVLVTRFRVVYRRSDGRNTPGVDVPHGFDGAVNVTIPASGSVNAVFELVRHAAKLEAPLATLITNPVVVTTIAEVTFFGRDLAGNEVSGIGNIQVNFANFGG